MGMLSELFSPATIVGYVFLAFVAAFVGRKRLIGFWGFFFLSLIVTPFATMFFLFVCTPARTPKPSKPRVKAGA
jgi:hypothetical protein